MSFAPALPPRAARVARTVAPSSSSRVSVTTPPLATKDVGPRANCAALARRARCDRATFTVTRASDGDVGASARASRSKADGDGAPRKPRLKANGTANGKSAQKKSALELALKNIFDDNDEDAVEQERLRWWRLMNSMWRAFLVLFVTPFVCAQSVKSAIVTPWLGAHWGAFNASLNLQQRQNVAQGIQKFEERLYYDRIISGAPRLHADVERGLLLEEARRLEDIEKKKSFLATGNVIGSLIFITMTVTIVTLQKSNISRLLGDISDEFIGLDAATQAFILMLGADMVVGYHSSDGWQAFLACIITHYGLDFHKFEMAVRIFVAVVPVTLDIGFKYWVFNKLRKISPSTQIILGEIERH